MACPRRTRRILRFVAEIHPCTGRDDAEMAPRSRAWRSGRWPRPEDAKDRQEVEIEQAGEAVRHL